MLKCTCTDIYRPILFPFRRNTYLWFNTLCSLPRRLTTQTNFLWLGTRTKTISLSKKSIHHPREQTVDVNELDSILLLHKGEWERHWFNRKRVRCHLYPRWPISLISHQLPRNWQRGSWRCPPLSISHLPAGHFWHLLHSWLQFKQCFLEKIGKLI